MGARCSRRATPPNVAPKEGTHAAGRCADAAAADRGGGTGGSRPTKAAGERRDRPAHGPASGQGPGQCAKYCAAGGEAFEQCVQLASRREEEYEASLDRMAGTVRDVFGPDAKMVNVTTMGDRRIFVFDGVIPDPVRDQLYGCLQGDAFSRTEFARPETREFRHHVVEYNPAKLQHSELYVAIDHLVHTLFPVGTAVSEPMEVYRIYTNAVMFSDVGFVHRDSNEADHVSAIIYPNPEWAPELGGETMFYNERGEIIAAVEPRPGRVVVFHGNVSHKGSPPTRLFWGSRYTTVFKFAPGDRRPRRPRDGPPPVHDGDLGSH